MVIFLSFNNDNNGLRIGFGLFKDIYTMGGQGDSNIFGGLVNVKIETNILKSVF